MCLGLGQCFWGFLEYKGDGFLGIIDLFYYKLKEMRETTLSIYSNQGVSFLKITSSMTINSSNEERGIPIYWSWGCFFFNP